MVFALQKLYIYVNNQGVKVETNVPFMKPISMKLCI